MQICGLIGKDSSSPSLSTAWLAGVHAGAVQPVHDWCQPSTTQPTTAHCAHNTPSCPSKNWPQNSDYFLWDNVDWRFDHGNIWWCILPHIMSYLRLETRSNGLNYPIMTYNTRQQYQWDLQVSARITVSGISAVTSVLHVASLGPARWLIIQLFTHSSQQWQCRPTAHYIVIQHQATAFKRQ